MFIQEVASKLNVSTRSVARWEKDPTKIDIKRLLQLADLYGIEAEDFFKPLQEASKPSHQTSTVTENIQGSYLYRACELFDALHDAGILITPEQVSHAIFKDIGDNGKFDDPVNRAKLERLTRAIEVVTG